MKPIKVSKKNAKNLSAKLAPFRAITLRVTPDAEHKSSENVITPISKSISRSRTHIKNKSDSKKVNFSKQFTKWTFNNEEGKLEKYFDKNSNIELDTRNNFTLQIKVTQPEGGTKEVFRNSSWGSVSKVRTFYIY